MGFDKELQELIQLVVKKQLNSFSQITIGRAVNVTDAMCDVERADAPTLMGVRLNALEDMGDGYVTTVPEENSYVLCGIIENDKTEAVILKCSQVSKVLWKVQDMTKVFAKDGVVWNGGDNGGMVIVGKLIERLNEVESALADLIQKYNAHKHPYVNVSTPAITSAADSLSTKFVSETKVEQIENPKIKH
ncbi:hypothetical protein CAP35_13740 [Chitinophagaceae bacterium IBVUCB1]|nr:hypothetical protein CAP35_13740 [Chitinophagaceae bacterium IBVUCB1]